MRYNCDHKNWRAMIKRQYQPLPQYEARDQPVKVNEKVDRVEHWIDAYAFFCYRADDDRALHVTLVVDDDTGVVLQRSSLGNTASRQFVEKERTSK